MTNPSEEKNLPASQKKIRDARRKGQVPQSRDIVGGFTLLASIGYLLLAWPWMRDHAIEVVNVVAASTGEPFAETSLRATAHAVETVALATVPLVAIVVGVTLLAGAAGTHGPVFATEPLTPNFDHINPAKGFTRIFSIKSAVEVGKSAFKIAVLAAAFWLVLQTWLQTLFETPLCGATCIGPVLLELLKPFAATAIIVFVAIGLADLILQRALFLREMRMTHSERKRERKDIDGDPLIRSERLRLRREQARNPVRTGLRHASLVIVGHEMLVGLRYVRGETPVPQLVCRSRGAAAAAMRAQANRQGVPVLANAQLVRALSERHGIGSPVRRDLFQPVADLLVKQGLA